MIQNEGEAYNMFVAIISLPRKVRLEDFLDDSDVNKYKNQNQNNHNYDVNKNQENFGKLIIFNPYIMIYI